GQLEDWLPGSDREARAAPWEPWAYWASWLAFLGDLWLFYVAYHYHSAFVKGVLGLVSTIVAVEGVSLTLNFHDAAYKVAGPDPDKWVTSRTSPWPSSPPWNRVWGLIFAAGSIAFAIR